MSRTNPYAMRQDCLFDPGLDEAEGVDGVYFRWPQEFEDLANTIYHSRDKQFKNVVLNDEDRAIISRVKSCVARCKSTCIPGGTKFKPSDLLLKFDDTDYISLKDVQRMAEIIEGAV